MSFRIKPYDYNKEFDIFPSLELGIVKAKCFNCGLLKGDMEVSEPCKRCGCLETKPLTKDEKEQYFNH